MNAELASRNCLKKCRGRSRNGFTFVELMVVLAVIAMLAVLLLPALATTARQDKSAVCMNNLRQIGVGMLMYADENEDTFHRNNSGSIPNQGQWTANPNSSAILSPNSGLAYWGVAYLRHVGSSREVFRCPSARTVDEWREDGLSYPAEFWLTSTYGVCVYLVAAYNPEIPSPVKVTSFNNPASMILAQDSAESRMEGSSDSIGLFPGQSRILTQWIGTPPPYGGQSGSFYSGYPFEWEWYRHEKRCQTLWLAGNVSKIPFTGLNVGIDYRYYTGNTPVTPIPGN